MKRNLVEKLMEYYKENPEDFRNDIQELDSWNGCLGDERLVPMDELNEYFSDPREALMRAYFGYDADDWDIVNGEKIDRPFNLCRNYFYFNGYGNLVSTDDEDYSDFLDRDFVRGIIDNESNLDLSGGAQEIIYEDEDE